MRTGVYGRQSRGKAKSIAEQLKLGHAAITDQGWQHAGDYQDGTSASRFATKPRGGWAEVRADVVAKALDVLVLWESSRGDRDAETWLGFLRECRDAKVRIHVVTHDRTYNLANARDWKTLAEDGISNAYETELLSVRVRRGHSGAAVAGRPSHGNAPYGYVRVYDPNTGALVGQEPHPEYAPVVREVIERVAKGDPISAIAKDLNDRAVPTGGARGWYRVRVREMAVNPAYVGLRVYNGQTYPGTWPALVGEAVFYAAQRVLTAPGRTVTRPGAQKHLLSYYMLAPCGSTMCAARGRYRCAADSCVSIKQQPVDALIEELVLAHLAKPEVYAALRHAGEVGDAEVAAAEGKVTELTERLNTWRVSAAKGNTTPETMRVIEAELTQEIAVATAAANRVVLPPELAGFVGGPAADVAARWAKAGVQARRAVLRGLGLRVVVKAHPSPGVLVPVHERVDVSWL
jgi:site-specific DNA recombinase